MVSIPAYCDTEDAAFELRFEWKSEYVEVSLWLNGTAKLAGHLYRPEALKMAANKNARSVGGFKFTYDGRKYLEFRANASGLDLKLVRMQFSMFCVPKEFGQAVRRILGA